MAIRYGFFLALFLTACSPDGRGPGAADDDAPPPPDAGIIDAHDLGFIDATPLAPDSGSEQPDTDGVVYGHSSTALYRIDPDTHAVTEVAPFLWPSGSFDSMTDI